VLREEKYFLLSGGKVKNINSLKNYRDFGRVYNQRESFANKYLVMYVADNLTACSRIGISVSKKVGNSVVRHRMTRLLREVFRLHTSEIRQGNDFVVVVRKTAAGLSYRETEKAFLHLLQLHGLRTGS
jgi:ribonuclease P protein component